MKSILAIASVAVVSATEAIFDKSKFTAWTSALSDLGSNIGGSTRDVQGVNFCQATDAKTFTLFDLKQFGNDLLQTLPQDKKLMWSVGTKGGIVGNICAGKFKLDKNALASKNVFSNEDEESKMSGDAKKLDGGNVYYVPQDGKVRYSFNGANISSLKDATTKKVNGFTLTYTSNEACKDDATKKFTLSMIGRCKKEVTVNKAEFQKGSSWSEAIPCQQTITVDSKNACDFITLNGIVATLGKFGYLLGGIFIVVGIALAFAGAKIIDYVFGLLVFMAAFSITFGVGYNVMPASAITTVSLVIITVVGILIGVVATYLLSKFQKEWATAILCGWAAVMGVEALIPAVYAAADGKILLVAGIIAFIAGFWFGRGFKTTLRAALMAGTGVGFFLLGVSMYAGGFTATKWSIYVYIGAAVVLGLLCFWFQRAMFPAEIERDAETGEAKDAFGDCSDDDVLGCDTAE